MKMSRSAVATAALFVTGMGFVVGAAAQATWSVPALYNYGTGTGTCDVPTNCTPAGAPATLSVSGWGSHNSSTYIQGADGTNSQGHSIYGGVSNQTSSGLGYTSSVGGKNETGSSPQHAFDNDGNGNPNGSTPTGASNEVLLLNFNGAKINLSQIQTGWSNTDTDVMVFRWDDPNTSDAVTAPTMGSVAGPTGLVGAGWSLVSAKDLDGGTSTSFTNSAVRTFDLSTGVGYNSASAAKVSSWWLVSTYFDGTGSVSGTKLDTSSKDYFKLLSFTGRVCTSTTSNGTCVGNPPPPPLGGPVPEPASLALVAVALVGVAGSRRRRRIAS